MALYCALHPRPLLTAAVLAWLLFAEQLGPLALAGAALLLGAVWLLARG